MEFILKFDISEFIAVTSPGGPIGFSAPRLHLLIGQFIPNPETVELYFPTPPTQLSLRIKLYFYVGFVHVSQG